MDKQRKPLSTKKPPIPSTNHEVIEHWMGNQIMPGIQPMIKKIDRLIHDSIPNLTYAIKWGNAFYGTTELGWLIEVAAYHVSANMVFLKGNALNPQPPLGTGESRYLKLRDIDELNDPSIIKYIQQISQIKGWP